jgi:hypothetical protein
VPLVRHRSGRFVYQELSSANGSPHLLVQTFKVALRLTTSTFSAARFKISDIQVQLAAQLIAGFPPRWPGFEPGSAYMRFVVDKVALGQVFSEYFGFPYRYSFHQLLHNHHHLSSGTGTIVQYWPQYQVDSVSPH